MDEPLGSWCRGPGKRLAGGGPTSGPVLPLHPGGEELSSYWGMSPGLCPLPPQRPRALFSSAGGGEELGQWQEPFIHEGQLRHI